MTTTLPTAGAPDLLGEIVTWDMGAQEVPLARVRQALDDAGLPVDAMGDLRKTTAFGRAVKDLKANRAIDRITTDKRSGVITFQFTTKSLDEARMILDFAFEATCTLDTTTGDIACPASPEIEAHAQKMFRHAIEHRQTSDITRLVQRMFEKHADLYAINPRKGVAYFVPEKFRSFSAQMEDFLAALGGTLLRFPVPKGTASGNRSVRDSVEAGLLAMAEELKTARDAWSQTTRGATMEHQVERLRIIQHKAESYAEYLGDRQAATLAILQAHKKELADRIAEITALKEEAKTAPDETPQADGSHQQTLFSETRPDDGGASQDGASADAYHHVERGDLPPDFTPTEAGELDLETSDAMADAITERMEDARNEAGTSCPNCGGTEFDADGDCARCYEPGIAPPSHPSAGW